MIPFFIQEEYYNEKAETTKRNYLVDLKKFCKYIYQHEHIEIPEAIQVQKPKPRKQYETRKLKKTKHTVPMAEPTISQEYYEFLKKYEKVNKK